MLPVENAVGAALVAGTGYLLGTHMSLTTRGAAWVRVCAALAAIAILVKPFIR